MIQFNRLQWTEGSLKFDFEIKTIKLYNNKKKISTQTLDAKLL